VSVVAKDGRARVVRTKNYPAPLDFKPEGPNTPSKDLADGLAINDGRNSTS
jgi:hypothetical protein